MGCGGRQTWSRIQTRIQDPGSRILLNPGSCSENLSMDSMDPGYWGTKLSVDPMDPGSKGNKLLIDPMDLVINKMSVDYMDLGSCFFFTNVVCE